MRLVTDLIPNVHLPIHTIATEYLIGFALVGALLFILLFTLSGLYKIRIYQSKIQEILDIFLSAAYWFFIYTALLYLSIGFLYTVEIPRLIVLFALIIGTIGIVIERILMDSIVGALLRRGMLAKRRILLLIKSSEEDLREEIIDSDIYDLIGYANTKNISDKTLVYIGGNKQLIKLIRTQKVDEILLVHTDFTPEELQEIFEYARIYGVRYRYIANSFETSKLNTEITFLGKIPVIEIHSIGLGPWGRVLKRVFDIVFSLIALAILSPFLIIVAVFVSLGDGYHPFYKSKRVGKDGKIFSMYKFRSMRIDAEQEKKKLLAQNQRKDGPLFKIENDPRITRFGRFIRRFDIDELPQLANVLIGDMSLIGPRPHLPEEVKLYKEHQKRVLTLKPGITGMAQSHGRHQNTFDDEVRLDTFYIENWSLLLDLKILLKTIGIVLARKGR